MNEYIFNIGYKKLLHQVVNYKEYSKHIDYILNDKRSWEHAKKINTIKFYKNYLSKFPNALYANNAKININKINKALEIEQQEWEYIKQENTKKSYIRYLEKYKDGQYKDEAQKKLKKIIEKEVDIAEWTKAKTINKKEAYEQYLKKYPNGIYIKNAHLALKKINQTIEKNLKSLLEWADKNSISANELPRDIDALYHLKELNISNCQLTELPESISYLTNLIELDVGFNNLTTLPDSIGNLTNLTKLNVRSNNLTTLPDSIGNLTNLTKLDVESNNLTTLPDWIGNLTNLTKLHVGGNNLTTLPKSIKKLSIDIQNTLTTTVEQNDNETFKKAENLHTKEAYQEYLNEFNNGLHKEKATRKLNEILEEEKTIFYKIKSLWRK